ncbi:MAG: site-specific integrase [Candidatus Aminicenantes bacterium]|nr:site-specific integrase [Candidatus Aminicenantes bacterium]
MFYRAIDWEIHKGTNPVKKIKFFREESRIQALSAEEVERILVSAKKIAAQAKSPLQKAFPDLIRLALNTGLRKAEILNLRWKNVKGDEIKVHGKGDRTRMVPLNQAAAAIIGRQPKTTEYVFDIPNRTQPSLFLRTIYQIKKQTGIPFHFHLLRHYFATSLLERAVDIVTIAAILGHSKMMTSLLYSHTDKEKRRRRSGRFEP